VQNTGAVLSIAFVLAIVTSTIPKSTLFAVFSGLAKGLSEEKLAPFIANMHTALWALAATSLVGAVVCLLRPQHERVAAPAGQDESAAAMPFVAGVDGAAAERTHPSPVLPAAHEQVRA
jgi:hypothetical protein